MRIVISEFISLDGVVQAPGGANEDPDGGFRHGGWSMQCFDPDGGGSRIGESLVDELRLVRMPVILGGGKTIFPGDGAQRTLELVSAVTSEAGTQVCTYRPVGVG